MVRRANLNIGLQNPKAPLNIGQALVARGCPEFCVNGAVDFSVLSLVSHNPGITSRQLCNALGVLAPNLVGMMTALEKRGLITRCPHPHDGRAMGLHLTEDGKTLLKSAEETASQLELDCTPNLSSAERKALMRLLKKIYK